MADTNYESTLTSATFNNTVLFIEPNNVIKYDVENIDERTEIAPNLEDYCLYVDLEAEIYNSTNETVEHLFCKYDPMTKEIALGTDARNEDNYFNWTQGSPYGNDRALTTSYADIGYKELTEKSEETRNKSIEYFGISSIQVNYDQWACPTVNMTFTDIRGISLFGVQEIKHSKQNGNGMTALEDSNKDIAESFFAAFFKFPYPKFTLYLKGFYGDPVAYDLAVNQFVTSFDSKTGNFNANVSFVSYKFGILNDLTMTSLASCVAYMGGGGIGQEYWQSQIDAGVFKHNGEDLISIADIASMYKKFEQEMSLAEQKIRDEGQKEIDNVNTTYQILTMYKDYRDSVINTAKHLVDTYNHDIRNELYNILLNDNVTEISSEKNVKLYNFLTNNGKFPEGALYDNRKKLHDILSGNAKNEIFCLYGKTSHVLSFRLADNAFGIINYKGNNVLHPYRTTSYLYCSNNYTSFIDEVNHKKFYGNYTIALKGAKNLTEANDGKTFCSSFYSNGASFAYANYNNNSGEMAQEIDMYTSPSKVVETNVYFNEKYDNDTIASNFGVDSKYDAFKSGIETLLKDENTTDKMKKTLKSIQDELPNIALYKIYPKCITDVKTWIPMFVNDDLNNANTGFGIASWTQHYSSDNTFVKPVLSAYRIDFSKTETLLNSLGVGTVEAYGSNVDTTTDESSEETNEQKDDKEKQIQEEIAQRIEDKKAELVAQYLTYDTSIVYLTKCLWAHVETFLDACVKTRRAIIDSKRTVASMGLNKQNSNLPKVMYDDTSSNVGAFPVILKQEVIKDSPNTRCAYEWMGNIPECSEADEVKLVDALIQGASHYYDIVHKNDETENQNSYAKSDTDIQTGVYLYLKQIFDKWVHSMGVNWLDKYGLDKYFKNHFLFIDTFYNNIGDSIGVNVVDFAKQCEEIFEHKNNTLLEFMTSYMQEANAILQPTQGFMLNDISNKDDAEKYYKKLFTPIPFSKMQYPDTSPYFVLIYRGDPSQHLNLPSEDNMDDGFMVSVDTEDSICEIPIGLAQKTLEDNSGYPIPAIGVSYGKQYESYFQDIKIDTSKPMANEVSLAAQYDLAGIKTTDGGTSENRNITLGQDLYTVYANNSYTCTVTMMGCMWIQPLMYFQLNNVPMFRGTYMIQKIHHDIGVGTMTTTFTGVRMSRYSSPFVNKHTSSAEQEAAYQMAREKAASYDNNCPYHKYDPNGEDGNGETPYSKTWLDKPFGQNFPSSTICMNGEFGLSQWYNVYKNKKTKYALASVIYRENSSDDLSCGLHAAILFNTIIANTKGANWCVKNGGTDGYPASKNALWSGHRMCAIRNNNKLLHGKEGVIDHYATAVTDSDRIVKMVENVFLNSPSILKGKMPDGDCEGADIIKPHALTMEDLQTVFYTSVCPKQKAICGHKGSSYYSVNSKTKGRLHFWSVKPENTTPSKNEADGFGEKLLNNSIIPSFNYYDKFEGGSSYTDYFTHTINAKNKVINFTLKDVKNSCYSARLLDILLNLYGEYISEITCKWDIKKVPSITTGTNPTNISISYNEANKTPTHIGFYSDSYSKTTPFVISENSFPTDTLKVLKKKFESLTDKKASAYIRNSFK